MIRYGDERFHELRFASFEPRVERRDAMWVDVELRFKLAEGSAVPDDLIDLTALVICTHGGDPIQIVPQDEGIDCEYQFTVFEKEQIEAFVRSGPVQSAIANAVSG
ncbi:MULTISPECIES: hypothetical protein [Cohnella]|uniref:hypothetical protein n=1 Tax=Cohnella TaxID=329857 RepID=UPI0009B99A1E|nr:MULTISPECIES: hypothetical protein [Cohnella]MBN2983881.1 hypothetical protein [Cohnella algarum]